MSGGRTDEIKAMKNELRAIWSSGGTITWSEKKIKRWHELFDKLEKLGVDITKPHFFLDDVGAE